MAELTVRQIEEGDRAQWEELWAAYNAFYGRHGVTALAPKITEATWIRFFDTSEPVHALVAEKDGKLLGIAHFLYHRSTIMVEPTCYLQDLYTAEEARGTGVGRALIEAVYDSARTAGSSRVYWHTHATNTTAMRLYDKVADHTGFGVYRRLL